MHGIVHAVVVTAVEGEKDKVYLRNYSVHLTQDLVKDGAEASGESETERRALRDIGPSIDFAIRRERWAEEEHFRTACKRPKEYKKKEVQEGGHILHGGRVEDGQRIIWGGGITISYISSMHSQNKNVVRDTIGNKKGHVFVDKQNLDQLALRKVEGDVLKEDCRAANDNK